MKKQDQKERDEKIIELFKAKSQKEIGKIFGMSQENVCRILKKYGIKYRKYRLNMSKLSLNVDYFKKIDDFHKAYWLGYICADGCIQKDNNKLTLISKDVEFLEKFKKDIECEHKISKRVIFDKRTNKFYTSYILQIGNELFVENIIKHGITHFKTDILKMPEMDEKYFSYFFAGMFDGDGSISLKKNHLRCSLITTKEIIDFINDYLLKNFGVFPCKHARVTKNKDNVYKQYWYKHSIDFLNFIYQGEKSIYLSRKYKIYEQFRKQH